ncbi:MAG: KamA family radical SAM protein [Desulfobulbaceae bacterium]|nr:KamA family radical SAM protein [Desulfobulbaceae bacterium]HIJ79542.1 KamA family radical SAM protein [Deltaproteobacteria bacterium]
MKSWKSILAQSITTPQQLAEHFNLDPAPLTQVVGRYPMRINPYYLSLIKKPGDPIWMQAVPTPLELEDKVCYEDPLDEENRSPVANLVHKYPDRALFLIANQCAMYCRFCTRKRKVGTPAMMINQATMQAGFAYLKQTPAIRDVLISGGDPLLLDDATLTWILTNLRQIPSIEIIRIGSRVPCTLPMRITTRLAGLLKKFHPLYINTHFNHPTEITEQAALACARLANAGIPLGNQTVLLKGVNDNPETIGELMHKLLQIRVKPYYLFQTDMTRGTNHFRTKIETGLEIIRSLIGHTSGMAVPTFAVDTPGGGGKIPLVPEYTTSIGREFKFLNYRGESCSYHNAL